MDLIMNQLANRILASTGLAAGVLGLIAATAQTQPGATTQDSIGGQDRPSEAPAGPEADAAPFWEAAGAYALGEPGDRALTGLDGLQHVYRLSDTFVTGAEPAGEVAFANLAELGIKTLLSVDGKVPDAELAQRYGIRTVHVPIRYNGITEDELLRIGKTFRELEGPFYVHCFHGVHRGPAAAAMGRVMIDGVSREQAMAEMRHWAGTSKKYEGLYAGVAQTPLPTANQTGAYAYDFEPAHRVDSLRTGMVDMARHYDMVKLLSKSRWQPLADHPDIDPLQETTQLHQLIDQVHSMGAKANWPEDFRAWMDQNHAASGDLVRALSACSQDELPEQAGQDAQDGQVQQEQAPAWVSAADRAYTLLEASCRDCHSVYRN